MTVNMILVVGSKKNARHSSELPQSPKYAIFIAFKQKSSEHSENIQIG